MSDEDEDWISLAIKPKEDLTAMRLAELAISEAIIRHRLVKLKERPILKRGESPEEREEKRQKQARKKEAIKLKKQGWKIDLIARYLRTTERTIYKWTKGVIPNTSPKRSRFLAAFHTL